MGLVRLARIALAGAAGVAAAASAAAQDEGVKQAEALVKASGDTVQAISDAKLQLEKTMGVYNALLADDAKDRKKLYKDLQKEMENTERRRTEITRRSGAMTNEAQGLFRSWETSTAAIENASLRKRSEERLQKTKASYAAIGSVGEKTQSLYQPVMTTLADHVKYLGHDLNPGAVASLKPDADKLNKRVEELLKAVDETIATTNGNIDALRPE